MTDKFINLEDIVSAWAWQEYDSTATILQKRLRKKNKNGKYIELQIDWSSCRFRDETIWGPYDTPQQTQAAAGAQVDLISLDSAEPTISVLFETKFVNDTEDEQQYTMKTQKTTKASVSTTFEEGLRKGDEMGLKLMITGQLIEANAGFKREVTLTNVKGETLEEELTWGVDSTIKVKAGEVAEAKLVVNERKQTGKFRIKTSISGMVYITFTNVKDNNSFVKATGNSIADIVGKYLEAERRKRDLSFVKEANDKRVVVETTGSCKFCYGISQEVKVNRRKITPDKQDD